MVERFQVALFVAGPCKNFRLRHFAASNRFELLAMEPQVDVAMHENLFALIEQSHNMVRIFDVKPKLIDQLASLADRVLGSHFVHGRVSVPFELRPATFV